jgi:Protein of unknown function (DUF4038)/Putative collagen-binding domain of a collagenase
MARALIRLSSNGRYFVDREGAPFFWLGDTQWQLFRDFTLQETELILKDRLRKGFSVIQVMVTGVGDGTTPNLEGDKPWLNDDPATPNEAYFKKVDVIVKLARQLGLVLAMYLCHNAQRNYINVRNARDYTRWVANRYRTQPHLIWVFVTEVPIQVYLPLIRELVVGIQEGTKTPQPISYHPDPVTPALSSGEIHTEKWLGFNMIQTWNYYEGIYGWVTRDYHRRPAKPVVMAEGAYEAGTEYGFPITPLLVRRQAYWSYLAGGFHSYGHNHNWRVPPDWKSALNAPGARQMKILGEIFRSIDWWNLTPDQRIILSQTVEGTTWNTAARSINGDWFLVYLASRTSVTVDLSRITTSTKVKAKWVDPQTGKSSSIGTFANTETPRLSTPPGWEDALLWVAAK